ncbi:MAG: hypothetical protein WC943_03785 [Elusimicrobiota bacterium]|jgi:hypothetical protein
MEAMNADASTPATKADVQDAFNKAVGLFRGELAVSTDRLAKRILESEARMDRLEDRLLLEMRGMKDQVLKAFEEATVRGQMYYEKALTHGDMIQSHAFQLQDHGKRLKALEDKVSG